MGICRERGLLVGARHGAAGLCALARTGDPRARGIEPVHRARRRHGRKVPQARRRHCRRRAPAGVQRHRGGGGQRPRHVPQAGGRHAVGPLRQLRAAVERRRERRESGAARAAPFRLHRAGREHGRWRPCPGLRLQDERGPPARTADGTVRRIIARPAGPGAAPEPPVPHPIAAMHQRRFHRLAAALVLALCLASASWTGASAPSGLGFGAAAGSSVVATPHLRAELLAHAPQGVTAGQPLWLGLAIDHQPGWHTYWKNPGDSGLPIELDWTLPAGLEAGEIAWPLPRKTAIGTLLNFGYEGAMLLPVPVTVASTFAPGPLAQDIRIDLHASWLVCRETCLPEEGRFTLQLPIRSSTALNGAAFEAAWQARPRPLADGAQGQAQPDGQHLQISVPGLPAALRGKTLDLFPETPQIIASASPWTQAWNGNLWTARIPVSPERSSSPATLPVVLVEQSAERAVGQGAERPGYRAELQVPGPWPPVAAVAGVSPALQSALEANAAQAAGTAASGVSTVSGAPAPALLAALLGALLR